MEIKKNLKKQSIAYTRRAGYDKICIQQAAGSRQQAAGSRQQAAGSRQQAAGSRQQAYLGLFNCSSKSRIDDTEFSSNLLFNTDPNLHIDSQSNTKSFIPNKLLTLLLITIFFNQKTRLKSLLSTICFCRNLRFLLINTVLRVPTLLRAFKSLLSLLLGLVLSASTLATTSHAVLSAKTVNTIQGTAPYLTFGGGTTKVTNTDELLGIELSDGRRYTNLTNTSSASAPIELPIDNRTLGDIKTLIPATLTSVNLSTLIAEPHNRWRDADGDGQGLGEINATGSLSMSLKDVNDKNVGLTQVLSACNSPYTLTLTSTEGRLTTQYGSPNSTNFTASNTTYYIKPKIKPPYVCYAKPNLSNNYGTQPEWDGTKGFIVPHPLGEPKANFPRTGANGLFFDMTVVGGTAANVIAANESSVGSGEVYATSGARNIKLKLSVSPSGANVVRVTLSGPSSGQKVGQPGPAAVNMPTTFNLYSDAAKTNKLYSFELSKWFIARVGIFSYNGSGNADNQTPPQYCASLGLYRVPSVSEYTNANGNGWFWGLFGNDNDNVNDNGYVRAIGNGKQKTAVGIDDGKGGLFVEWGATSNVYYPNSDFEPNRYWAVEEFNSRSQYIIDWSGGIGYTNSDTKYRAACVTP